MGAQRLARAAGEYFAELGLAERDSYALDDLLPTIRAALSNGGELYALPFYGESSIVLYRTDLFARAGLTMPLRPTWQRSTISPCACPASRRLLGIVLRGLPGWGEVLAPFNTVVNAFGGRWFDGLEPAFTSLPWAMHGGSTASSSLPRESRTRPRTGTRSALPSCKAARRRSGTMPP